MKTSALALAYALMTSFLAAQENRIVLFADSARYTISPNLYGNFAEHLGRGIYDGIFVGKNSEIPNVRGIRSDIVKAFKEVGLANLRWPGGCFADEYHWMDGIGLKRPAIVNTTWGGVTEDNSFGTHEFLDLCEQVGCEPVICANLGSSTTREIAEWVEYINSNADSPMTQLRKVNGHGAPWKVKFWGIGNESWACGGNMRPEYYFDKAREYSTFMKNYNKTQLYKILVGPGGADYQWTETVMALYSHIPSWQRQGLFSAISLHFYTVEDWSHKGSATKFGRDEYVTTINKTFEMEELVRKNIEILDKYDPLKNLDLVVDEWGDWYDVEPGTNPAFLYQQNTLRDAIVAAINLNIFNNYCDRVKMANIAQAVNVLQSILLTRGKDLVRTPTFYVFKMYTVHHGATLIPAQVSCGTFKSDGKQFPVITSSASIDKDHKIHITLSNEDPDKATEVTYELRGAGKLSFSRGEIITANALNAFNDFGQTPHVGIADFKAVTIKGSKITVSLPAKSVVMVELQ